MRIPAGKVATYGDVAEFIGCPRAARAVGSALHNNQDPKNVKCHRVVHKDGSLSNSFAFGGGNRQAELLRDEGVEIDFQKNKVVNI